MVDFPRSRLTAASVDVYARHTMSLPRSVIIRAFERPTRSDQVLATCFGLILVAIPCAGATQAPLSEEVRTIAGTGHIGFLDGPAGQATFSAPSDVARANDGTIYISDEAAQRIRALTPDGTLTTVAGSGETGLLGLSVLGGYRDGPAPQALFNHPLGMAVGPDGSLYIADSKNTCIRRLHNGIVTTVVGVPGSTAAVDGPSTIARLVSPHALAFDKMGRLWIADTGVGLRRFDPNGDLTTVPLHSSPENGIFSISISPDRDDPVLLAVTQRVVFILDLATGKDTYLDDLLPAEGAARPFGRPSRIIAIGHGEALFTDGQSNNIRYLRLPKPPFYSAPFTRTIAGGELEQGIDNAGFSDGARSQARFYSPRGLVLVGSKLIVADTGNRRLREIGMPSIRRPETGLSGDYRYDTKHFEIAYVGPSVTFWDSFGDDSICAIIEKRLDASERLRLPARCHTVRIDGPTVQQIFDYVTNYLAFEPIDLLVIPIDPGSAAYPGFPDAMRQLLAKLDKRTRVVMVWQYNYFTFSDDESLVQRDTVPRLQVYPDDEAKQTLESQRAAKALVATLPIFAYDSFDDFVTYERAPGHLPLYENPDTHFNRRGNEFMANHISEYLLRYVIDH